MDIDEDKNELERLFWGVIKPYDTGIVPAGTESIGLPTALTRALAIVLYRQAVEVRAALKLVEDALPNEREHPGGISRIIRSERARLDRLDTEVDRVVREMR